jgi:hypothetical protein
VRALVLVAALACVLAARAEERVLDFRSHIRVTSAGELVVTERIEVLAEGKQIRRGIQRDFPTTYQHWSGTRTRVPFGLNRMRLNGGPVQWSLHGMENGVRVRIGDPNVLLRPGRYVYEIEYRTARQIGFFAAHDELYWNVNGNGWTFAFDALAAEVELPARVAPADLRLEAYTGAFGERGRDYAAQATEAGARFRATRRLEPGEGLTLVVGFPKGLVAEPTRSERLERWLADNRGAAAGIAGWLLMSAVLWVGWLLVGRDPRAGPEFPRYDPPPGIGPAGARFVQRMGFDHRCVAAALLGLGQRGYLKLRQRKDDYEIECTGNAPREWFPGEGELRAMLPAAGAKKQIGGKHDPAVEKAIAAFEKALRDALGDANFFTNRRWSFAALGIGAATIWIMLALEAWTPLVIFAALAMLVELALFRKWLPAYTVAGRRLADHIDGLKQYLSIAEKDELARLKAPPPTPEEFARLLPYAVALGVENAWAGRFAALIGTAALAQAAAAYYSSSSGSFGGSSSAGFSDSVSSLGSAISAASTAPGSSSGSSGTGGGGSSGGGSSGGGGGGGGGSGW